MFGVPVSHVGYHFMVLKKYGAVDLTDTQARRGATEHFYASTISGCKAVVELLEDAKASDKKAPWIGGKRVGD